MQAIQLAKIKEMLGVVQCVFLSYSCTKVGNNFKRNFTGMRFENIRRMAFYIKFLIKMEML